MNSRLPHTISTSPPASMGTSKPAATRPDLTRSWPMWHTRAESGTSELQVTTGTPCAVRRSISCAMGMVSAALSTSPAILDSSSVDAGAILVVRPSGQLTNFHPEAGVTDAPQGGLNAPPRLTGVVVAPTRNHKPDRRAMPCGLCLPSLCRGAVAQFINRLLHARAPRAQHLHGH